ncbi:MAG TPA: 3-dehydroquinate synthase [Acidimicrobiia bacterium]|nr:3-dehydroquinate synthase [Acidimicrobiia bacterium]
MRRVTVDLGSRSYDVMVGPGVLLELAPLVAKRSRVAVVSQADVQEHWGGRVATALGEHGVAAEVFPMPAGERAKTLSTVEELCRSWAEWGLLRGDVVVALGGGVVGDVAGFAAASYHRGIDYIQAPTTLLAQVDSAIGGKTGVNLPEGKNLVGAFHQPLAVLADVDTLMTLPEREYRSGLGEILKYACVLDRKLYDLVVEQVGALNDRDPATLEEIVVRCASIKAEVVAADERELTGMRARLNYGHTLAHALETVGEFDLMHGEAVAVGVVFAAELARVLERIDETEVARQRHIVEVLGLPTVPPADLRKRVRGRDLVAQMLRDKKSRGGLSFVLAGPDGLDRVEDPSEAALAQAFAAVGIEE